MNKRVAVGAAAGIAGGAALIAIISVVSRIAGFGRQLVFQSVIGETALGEIYVTINALPNVVFEIVAGGALASVVVPLLASAAADGDHARVERTLSALLGWTLIILVPVAVVGVLVSGPVTSLMLAGKGGAEGVAVGQSMLLLFLPQIPLYGLAVVTAGALQAHRRFLAAAVAPIVSSLVLVGVYVTFGAMFAGDVNRLSSLDRGDELLLAGGTTLGVLALALATIVPLLLRVTRIRPTLRFPDGVARRARNLASAGFATLVAQQLAYVVSYVTSNRYASTGGAVAYVNSWMVYLLPFAVLVVPIATAAFPRLSENAQKDQRAYARTLASSTRAVVTVSALGAAVLVAVSWPVARFFTTLSPSDAPPERMAWALILFAPGLLGYGLVAHLGRALFARDRGRAAATAIATGWLVVVAAALIAGALVPAVWVTAALGGAHTLGMSVAGGLLLLAVVQDSGRGAAHRVPRVAVVAILAAVVSAAVGWMVAAAIGDSSVVALVGGGVLTAIVVVACMTLLVLPSLRGDLRMLRRRSDSPDASDKGADVT